jgi:short-subunit dehydrogenase
MKIVVITGSTRGIGYGLADSFLALGCGVTVSGRTETAVKGAVEGLSVEHDPERIFGKACDVTSYEQVEELWDASVERFSKIDIWINNAGVSHPRENFWEHKAEQIQSVVETNITGLMYGTKVALRGFFDQGSGAMYNMEGLGSDGRIVAGLAVYGSTKASVNYLDRSLVLQTDGTPVIVGSLRPGMVVTDFLMADLERRPDDEERAKRIFNILADRVENVAPWMAQKILENDKNGASITYLNTFKVMGRFLTAPFSKRDLFGDE